MAGSFRTWLQRIADIGIPIATAIFLMGIAGDVPGEPGWLAVLAGVVGSAALYWRRSRPVPVMAVTLVASAVYMLIKPTGLFPYAALIALISLARRRPPYASLPALAATLGVTALAFPDNPDEDVWFAILVAIVVWALGDAARSRDKAVREAARRAVGEEQARIARELHDVLAHSVSVIVVQAAAADDVFDERPDQARSALRSIEATGREALADLRRLLAGVRPGEPAAAQPGVQRLGELAEPLRAAGLEVELDVADGGALPAGVDLSAYRIVQEALTNTLRHSGARRAAVVVRARDGVLELDVRDDGCGGTPGDGGRGIAGMRERAAMVGGTLEAGPAADGGFRVLARLPVGSAP